MQHVYCGQEFYICYVSFITIVALHMRKLRLRETNLLKLTELVSGEEGSCKPGLDTARAHA